MKALSGSLYRFAAWFAVGVAASASVHMIVSSLTATTPDDSVVAPAPDVDATRRDVVAELQGHASRIKEEWGIGPSAPQPALGGDQGDVAQDLGALLMVSALDAVAEAERELVASADGRTFHKPTMKGVRIEAGLDQLALECRTRGVHTVPCHRLQSRAAEKQITAEAE